VTRERALTVVAAVLGLGLALVVITGVPKGLPAVTVLAAATAGALALRTWPRSPAARPRARAVLIACSS
jgi:hypothetical protein